MLDHNKITKSDAASQVYQVLKGASKPKAVGLAQTRFRDDYPGVTPWARLVATGQHYHYVVCVDKGVSEHGG